MRRRPHNPLAMLALMSATALSSGCNTANHTTPSPPPVVPSTIADAEIAPFIPPPAQDVPAEPLTIDQAIARAIAHSGQIATLQAAAQVATQRKRAATDLQDPELNFAWEEDTADAVNQDWSTQDTITRSSSRESSQGTQIETPIVADVDNPPNIQTVSDSQSSSSTSRQHNESQSVGASSDDGQAWSVGLRVYVPNPWLMGPKISAGKAEIQAAESDLRDAQNQVVADVWRYFAKIHHQTNDLVLANATVRLHDVVVKTVRMRAESTEARTSELLAVTHARISASTERDRIRQECAQSLRGLAALLKVPAQTLRIDTRSLMDTPRRLPDDKREQIETMALRCREDLTALQWRALAARDAWREIRNESIPWFSHIDASYGEGHQDSWANEVETGQGSGSSSGSSSSSAEGLQSDRTIFGDLPTDNISQRQSSSESGSSQRSESGTSRGIDAEDSSQWQVGFMVTLPIFSWLANNADDVAFAEYKLAMAQYDEKLQEVQLDVRNAIDEVDATQREWASYRAEAAPFIAQMRKAIASMQNTDEITPDQVAAIKIQMIDSLRLWREAHLRYRLAVIELERAVGVPLQDMLQNEPQP